jgi:hypothetical protein
MAQQNGSAAPVESSQSTHCSSASASLSSQLRTVASRT